MSIQAIMSSMKTIKTDMAISLVEEVTQRSKRMNNLIISGIPELSNGTIEEKKISRRGEASGDHLNSETQKLQNFKCITYQ